MQVSSEVFGARKEVVNQVNPMNPFEAFKVGATATPEVQLAAAESRFGKDREGKMLWEVAVGQLDAEHGAAALADAAKQSAEKQAKKILEGRQAEQRIDKLTTAIAKGKREPLTDEDRALVASVVSPEQKMALAQGVLDQAAEEQRQMKLRAEARGTKPKESLSKEAALMRKASLEQQRQAEVGLEMVQILKTEPLTIDKLREAVGAEKRFKRAEGQRGKTFDRLTERFGSRYPDRADVLRAERAKIDEDLKGKRDALVSGVVVETMPQEQKVQRVDSAVITSGLGREENRKALASVLGIIEVEQPDGTKKQEVKAGSLSDAQITAEAEVAALDKVLAESIAAAEGDPRLADVALQVALERQIALRAKELATEKIAAEQARAKAEEASQVALEKARAEGEAKSIARAEAYDKGLKAVNKLLGKAFGLVGKVGGGAMAAVGVVVAAKGLALTAAGVGAVYAADRAEKGWSGRIEERQQERSEVRQGEMTEKELKIAQLEAELAKLRGESPIA